MTDYKVTDTELTSVADAIRTKGGTSAQLEWPTGFASAVGAISGEPYPVVGDGKTHLHIVVIDMLRPTVDIRFAQTVANGVTVDWGDGSATETYSGTAATTHGHTYAAAGEYEITLDCTSGYITYGGSTANSLFVTNSTADGLSVRCTRLVAAEIGSHGIRAASLGGYTFYRCWQLQKLTLPEGITSIGAYNFDGCYSLKELVIPSTVTSIGTYAFRYNYSLHTLVIPSGVTSIGNHSFNACYSLRSVTIPSGVTSLGSSNFLNNYSLSEVTIPAGMTNIGAAAFQNCYSVKEYHLLPTTPPTLGNTSAFTGISSDCVIYVPSGSLADYQAATNWSTYASYMQEE